VSITQQVLIGNCAEILKTLPSESVDCVVTSPPYWGLRDYKTEPIVWDAVEGCEHDWEEVVGKSQAPISESTSLVGGHFQGNKDISFTAVTSFCSKCGAWRGQLGLEPTPQLYIEHLVSIFDEIKRVLKKTGTCWVNLGDTYGGTTKTDKSLAQIPSRFAIAMTDSGWILRNEIIWHKPNALPSSVKDRFTVDFEKLFFFVKSKKYYFEQQFEPMNLKSIERQKSPVNLGAKSTSMAGYSKESEFGTAKNKVVAPNENGRNKRTVWTITTKAYRGAHFAVFPPELVETPIKAGCPVGGVVLDPFGGTGTTSEVARRLGRASIIIELNPDYLELVKERARTDIPDLRSFEEVTP
jgi:site-specific DNA-methyltransferase (cytosine-N4-specific)